MCRRVFKLVLFSMIFPKAVDCGQISAPVNGSITGDKSTYPSYVDIYCDQGFVLRGSHRRKCQANGQWNGTDASCAGNKPEYHNNLLHHLLQLDFYNLERSGKQS